MTVPARRTPIVVLSLFLLLALVPSASAAQRSFSAQRVSGSSAEFRLLGVDNSQVAEAQLRAGGYRTLVPAGRIRRGTLRLRLPRQVAAKLARTKRARPGKGRNWPTLTVQTSGDSAPAAPSAQETPSARPTATEPKPATTPASNPAPASTPAADEPTGPTTPGTPVAESTSGFETGNFSEFTSLQNKFGSLAVTSERAYQGSKSARATWAGGPQGAQRVWQNTDWKNGSEVWYGMAVYVPASTEYCYWNPIRWDNYDLYGGVDDDLPGEGDVGGVTVEQGNIYIMKSYYGGVEHKLVNGGALAKGRWTWIELHQKFSDRDGEALSELYVDGQKRGASTKANSAGRRITDLRAGVVNVASSCSTPNAVDFDRVTISNSQRGPLS